MKSREILMEINRILSDLPILPAVGHVRHGASALRSVVAAALYIAATIIASTPQRHAATLSPVFGEHSKSVSFFTKLIQHNQTLNYDASKNDYSQKNSIAYPSLSLLQNAQAYDFISANAFTDLDFSKSMAALSGVSHSRLIALSCEAARIINPKVSRWSTIGHWEKKPENSTLGIYWGDTWREAVLASAAICGFSTEQLSVLTFFPELEGPDTMVVFSFENHNFRSAYDIILKSGIPGATIGSLQGDCFGIAMSSATCLGPELLDRAKFTGLPVWVRNGKSIEISDYSSRENAGKKFIVTALNFYLEVRNRLPQISSILENWKRDYLTLLEFAGMGTQLNLLGRVTEAESNGMLLP